MTTTDKSRRNFLLLLASGALTAVGGIKSPQAKSRLHYLAADPLAFANIVGLGPPQEAELVEDTYCPLHKEKMISKEVIPLVQFNAAEALLKQEFAQMNKQWQDSYTIAWTLQHYGVPDTSSNGRDLLDYCKNAQDFLYGNVKRLFAMKPAWSLLPQRSYKPQMNSTAFNAYVGRYTYLLVRIQVTNTNKEIQQPYLVEVRPLERSLNFISADPKSYLPNKSTVYIIPGLTSLSSPFSELLHLSHNEPAMRYAKELAQDLSEISAQEQARHFSETITEAMAITLASQFLHNDKYISHLEQLGTLVQHLYEYLPDLDKALAFCQEVGVQEFFDFFQDEPGLLRKRIKEYQFY